MQGFEKIKEHKNHLRHSLGSQSQDLIKITYISLIRPTRDNASSIWAHTSKTTLEKLDNVQARAAKAIDGVVSSATNLKVVKECSFDILEKRRYNLIKLTKIDGSSDVTFLNRDSGVFMTTPTEANVIGEGAISSCFTYELRTITEALDVYETPYSRAG
ncbi:hypothetical protein TNCV_1035271 [Trichonephila clavipes]|nr:hypothetical protein TNCV_1035271 [Trichonephila clavipes]